MDRKLTSLEVIGMAIRSEEDAAKFYSHIAARINNELVSKKYRHLAKEETGHRKMLVDLYKKILEYLVHVETGHEMMLKSELEAYRQDKDWYTGLTTPEMVHAGP